MCIIIHTCRYKAIIYRKSSQQQHPAHSQCAELSPLTDHNVQKCPCHGKDTAGSSGGYIVCTRIVLMYAGSDTADQTATQADHTIFQMTGNLLKRITQKEQYQHIIAQMGNAKMQKHTAKQSENLSLQDIRQPCSSPVHHMICIHTVTGQFHQKEKKNIDRHDRQIYIASGPAPTSSP